jgi:hypothetical protein
VREEKVTWAAIASASQAAGLCICITYEHMLGSDSLTIWLAAPQVIATCPGVSISTFVTRTGVT